MSRATHIGIRFVEASPVGEGESMEWAVSLDGSRWSRLSAEQFEAIYTGIDVLDWPRALHVLLQGGAVARKVWRNQERIVARDGALWLEVPGDVARRWRADQHEVFATDWRWLP